MSFDDLLIAIIIGGFGLTGAYFRAEYVSWRRYKAAERRKEVGQRAWHINELRFEENDVPVPSMVQAGKSVDAKGATRSLAITDGEGRVAVDRVPGRSIARVTMGCQ